MKLFSVQMPKITLPKLKIHNPETGRKIDINGPTAKKIKKKYTGIFGWVCEKLNVQSKDLQKSFENTDEKKNEKIKLKRKKINIILATIGVLLLIIAGYLGLSDFREQKLKEESRSSKKSSPKRQKGGDNKKKAWDKIELGFYTVMTALAIVVIYLGVKAFQESKVEEEDLGIQMKEVERRKLRNSVFWFDFKPNLKTYYNIQFLENNDSFFVEKKYMTINELENVDSCPGNNMLDGNRPISKEDYDCDGAPINEILHDSDSFEQREDNKLGWVKINVGNDKEPEWKIDPQSIYKDKIQRKLWIAYQNDKYKALHGGNKKKEEKSSTLKEIKQKHFNINCRISNKKYDNLVTTTLHFMQQNEKFLNDKDLPESSKILKVIVPYYHKMILKNTAIILKCKEKILNRKDVTPEEKKNVIDFISFNVKYLKAYMSA